jgi:hypothetical protein
MHFRQLSAEDPIQTEGNEMISHEENVIVVETHINTFPDRDRVAQWRPVRHRENAGFGECVKLRFDVFEP